MAYPNNILPPGISLVLKRNLLQRIDRLSESLGKEGASHLFVRQYRLHMIERVQQVSLASRIALHHLQRLVAEHHEFGWRVELRRLRRQVFAHHIADVREILEARIEK